MVDAGKRETRYDSADRENRFDVSSVPLSRVRITPQGFLEIPAYLTRTGVLEYTRTDGSTVRELRLPEEVFSQDSLNSFMTAPVTEFHKGPIDPSNVQQHQSGIVLGSVHPKGKFASGKLLVQRKDTIAKVQSKELVELSPGYSCNIEVKSGVYEGQRYDQIQRNIVNNHVALLPKGFGRSGSEVALRADSAYSAIEFNESAPKSAHKENNRMKIQIRLDGILYTVELDDTLAPTFEAAVNKLQTERADAKEAVAKAEGSLAAAQKTSTELQERLDSLESPEAIAKLVDARASLVSRVKEVIPEVRTDGKTDDELRIEFLKAKGWKENSFKGQESAYIQGIFEAEAKSVNADTKPPVSVGPVVGRDRADSIEEENKPKTAAQVRQDMLEKQENAWKKKSA